MLLFGIATAVLGLCLVIWPAAAAATICLIIGWILIVAGIFAVINYFAARKSQTASGMTLFLGIVELVFGIMIVTNVKGFVGFLGIMFAVILFIHSINDVAQAFAIKNMGYKGYVGPIIFSIIGVILAVVILINPFATLPALMILAGIALVIDGVSDIVIALRVGNMTRNYVDPSTIDPDKIVK